MNEIARNTNKTIKFTIQNVPIKLQVMRQRGGGGDKFTIQNVPIKSRCRNARRCKNDHLQYKMFLLNPEIR